MEKVNVDILVIDDDPLIGLTWSCLKEKMNIDRLYYFPNLEDCLSADIDFIKINLAFIDLEIKNSSYTFLDIVSYLKSKGVTRIIVASGQTDIQEFNFSEVSIMAPEKIPFSLRSFL